MNDYVYSLLIISLIGGLLTSFLSSFGTVKKYVEYFIGLLIVISFLFPILEVVKNTQETKNNITDFFNSIIQNEQANGTTDLIINSGKDAIIKGIKKEIINEFQLEERDIIVEIELDENNIEAIKITKITVTLTGKASWADVDSVQYHLKKIIGGNIYVTRK